MFWATTDYSGEGSSFRLMGCDAFLNRAYCEEDISPDGQCSGYKAIAYRKTPLVCPLLPPRFVLAESWWGLDDRKAFRTLKFGYHSITGQWRDAEYCWEYWVGYDEGHYQGAWRKSNEVVVVYGDCSKDESVVKDLE